MWKLFRLSFSFISWFSPLIYIPCLCCVSEYSLLGGNLPNLSSVSHSHMWISGSGSWRTLWWRCSHPKVNLKLLALRSHLQFLYEVRQFVSLWKLFCWDSEMLTVCLYRGSVSACRLVQNQHTGLSHVNILIIFKEISPQITLGHFKPNDCNWYITVNLLDCSR